MIFVSIMVGIINYTESEIFLPIPSNLLRSLPGLLDYHILCNPILSPVLGPGAVIAQVVGVFSVWKSEREQSRLPIPSRTFCHQLSGWM